MEWKLCYHGELICDGRSFLKSAALVVSKNNGEIGKIVEKPNVHWAVELCVHTIRNSGHGRNYSEMVLEMYHRVFKEWLEIYLHEDAHLKAVERALSRDCLGRLYVLYKRWDSSEGRERECAEVGLRRLLLGEDGILIDESTLSGKQLIETFHKFLSDTFR